MNSARNSFVFEKLKSRFLYKLSINVIMTAGLVSFIASCSSDGGDSKDAALFSSIPQDLLTESGVCDATCISLRKDLELKNILRIRTNNTVQGALVGAAAGCAISALVGSSEDCVKGTAVGAVSGGFAGNIKGSQKDRERLKALQKANKVANALRLDTVAIQRAKSSMRTLTRIRQARISDEKPVPLNEANAYRTDLLVVARSLRKLEKTQKSVKRYRDLLQEDDIVSNSLEAAIDVYSSAIAAFRDDFLKERQDYSDTVVAGACLTISDQTDDEEYTPIPLPGCGPSGT